MPVVGAWNWLPDGDIGVITEIDYAEAFRPLTILRWTFWGLFALAGPERRRHLRLHAHAGPLRREAQKAAIEAQQIGQYKLERKLGAGGMGVVYKGHHAMLRRPTAIKMLDVDKVNEGVDRALRARSADHQPAQQSEHGRDLRLRPHARRRVLLRDGVPRRHRPADARRALRPAARAARDSHPEQICGSLYEAHSLGLVHRDIKPANIMLNRRGGEPDVVKVLDFGLVKALDEQKQAGLTQQASLTGTPLYMSPEAIQMPNSVDARSDIYAVGAVGYFLLTGAAGVRSRERRRPVPEARRHAARRRPRNARARRFPPSSKARSWPAWKNRGPSARKRPATWRMLIARCPEAREWSIEDADAWWGRHERGQTAAASSAPPVSNTATHRHDVTIDHSR